MGGHWLVSCWLLVRVVGLFFAAVQEEHTGGDNLVAEPGHAVCTRPGIAFEATFYEDATALG